MKIKNMIEKKEITVDTTESFYLTFSKVSQNMIGTGKNELIIFSHEAGADSFTEIKGNPQIKIGRNKSRKYVFPIEDIEGSIENIIKKGFLLINNEKPQKVTKRNNKIVTKNKVTRDVYSIDISNVPKDEVSRRLLKMLINASRQYFASKVESTQQLYNIPKKNIMKAFDILFTLDATKVNKANVRDFNDKLIKIYTLVPHTISDLYEKLYINEKQATELLKKESEYLTSLLNFLYEDDDEGKNSKTDSEIEIKIANEDEVLQINKLLQYEEHKECTNKYDFAKAYPNAIFFSVKNKKTEKRFKKYLSEKEIQKTNLLFHGSGIQNIYSILINGTKCAPTNVSIVGKMFGNGIYFANNWKKSERYSRNVYASSQNEKGAILAIFEVATGNPFYPKKTGDNGVPKSKEYDCLWAKGGRRSDTGLINDEIIIYNDNACVIRYLIYLNPTSDFCENKSRS